MRLLLLLMLAGCTTVDYVAVRYVEVPPEELAKACDRDRIIGRSGGCVVKRGDIWEIRAPRPRDVRDARALEVLGHEFYCHAWLGIGHTDEHGVRRDPRHDCVPQERL